MHQSQNPHPTQAFTLVELLVCIAIIGTIAAVLLPNLLNARRYANEGASIAYLRQCVTAVESMRGSANQKLPEVTSCEDPLLNEARLQKPASVNSTSINIRLDQDSYTITVNSITGKLFYHDGRTVLSGS